jgi:hypothetical protein
VEHVGIWISYNETSTEKHVTGRYAINKHIMPTLFIAGILFVVCLLAVLLFAGKKR